MGGFRIAAVALGYALAAMALNILVSFLWVWIYSVAVAPGHDEAFYQDYATRAAPISSIVAGLPILFLFGWLIARRRTGRSALVAAGAVALIYILIDVTVLALVAGAAAPWSLAAMSQATKFAGALAGGYFGRSRA